MEAINFFLNEEDKERLNKIFARTEKPDFTIVHQERLMPDSELYLVRIFFESSTALWYLLKQVFIYEEHDRRMKEIFEDGRRQIEQSFLTLKNK